MKTALTIALVAACLLLAGLLWLRPPRPSSAVPTAPRSGGGVPGEAAGPSPRTPVVPAAVSGGGSRREEGEIRVRVLVRKGGAWVPEVGATVLLGVPDAEAASGDGGEAGWTRETDAEGCATFRVPSPDAGYQASAESADRTCGTLRPVYCAPGETVQIHLRPTRTIRGRVLGATAGCPPTVTAYSNSWAWEPGRRVVPVAEDGTFTVTGIVDHVFLLARSDDRAPSERVLLKDSDGSLAKAERDGAILVLGPEAVPFSLRLRLPGGEPLPEGRQVSYSTAKSGWRLAEVAAGGEVALLAVPGAEFELFVRAIADAACERWMTTDFRTRLEAPWPEVIDLPAASGPVRLCVLLDDEPAGGLDFSLVPEAGGRSRQVRTGPDGYLDVFLDRPLPPGRYRLEDESGERVFWSGQVGPESEGTVEVRVGGLRPLVVALVGGMGAPSLTSLSLRAPNADPDSRVLRSVAEWVFSRGPEAVFLLDPAIAAGPLFADVVFPGRSRHVRFPVDGRSRLEIPFPGDTGSVRARLADPTMATHVPRVGLGSPGGDPQEGVAFINLDERGEGGRDGIPEGEYEWRALGVSGEPKGIIFVRAGVVNELVIPVE